MEFVARTMITAIEDYFTKGCGRCERFATPDCSTRQWSQGLNDLRQICLDAGLVETVKWGHPCYMHGDRNVVIFGAFRGDFRLTFFNAALMQDPYGVLEKQGPNTRYPDMIRFVDSVQVAQMKAIILSYLMRRRIMRRPGSSRQRMRVKSSCPTSWLTPWIPTRNLQKPFGA